MSHHHHKHHHKHSKSSIAPENLVTPAPLVHKEAAGMMMADKVMHAPEKVINHAPLVEKEIINERPVEVKREHHVQPIIHETEHRIQPVIKTKVTAERPIIEKDRNVMEAPIVERAALPAGLEAIDRATPQGVLHKPILEKDVVVQRPVEVKHEHHVQPIIHEREHRIQPIIKTEVTAERPIIEQDRNVMEAPIIERAALPAGLEAVERATAQGIMHKPKIAKDVIVEHPVQVKHEHHVQPIVHEREHHIQPIIKTEVVAEQKHMNTEKNVMMAPIVERVALPAGLEAVERTGPAGVIHRPKMEKEVIVEHPVQVQHERHIQPIIHEREHHIQPVVKTEVTAERPVIEQARDVLLPPIVEAPVLVSGPALGAGVLPANTIIDKHHMKKEHKLEKEMMKQDAAIGKHGMKKERKLEKEAMKHDTAIEKHDMKKERKLEKEAMKHDAAIDKHMMKKHDAALDMETKRRNSLEKDHMRAGLVDERPRGMTADRHHHDVAPEHHKASMGQKLKGALKEVQGTITRNPAKKEEGKMLMHGIDPSTATQSVSH